MTLEALLLSADPEVLRVIRPTLEKMSIDVEICTNANSGSEMLASEKFDAVVVDCDDLKGGMVLLKSLRETASNKNSVTFAILNGRQTTTQAAFGMGANFVLQKPVSILNASRCFHAALNFMVKERRRYFRQPVEIPVRVVLDDRTVMATSANISEGGMSLTMRETLPKGAVPRLQFTLPGTNLQFEIESQVAWASPKGLVGFRFHALPKSSQFELERWLDERMEKEFPGAKARIAAAEALTAAP